MADILIHEAGHAASSRNSRKDRQIRDRYGMNAVMLQRVSATFNVHYLRMDDARWNSLGRVYERLPSFIGVHDGTPYWYGTESEDERTPQEHLWASVEPSGLLVEGMLEQADWERWQSAFLSAATAALGFTLKLVEEDSAWPYGGGKPGHR